MSSEWGEQQRRNKIFGSASSTCSVPPSSRGYAIALAPQVIHARATLLSQLVSSRAHRQIEFLAVGSLFVVRRAETRLERIPSTREDVFSNTSIPARAKRRLMKCLHFVLDYQGETQTAVWRPHAREPLVDFLRTDFGLDARELRDYVLALTLSLDSGISVEHGLAAIHRHVTSMGAFGPGFAAVCPKYGGLAEMAQIGCRAAAVGGAV